MRADTVRTAQADLSVPRPPTTHLRSHMFPPLLHRSYLRGLAACAVAAFGLTAAVPVSASAAPRHFKLVVLGDSFSAGNGGGGYVAPKECFRSPKNWGAKYRDALEAVKTPQGAQKFRVSYVNRACSGGVAANFYNPRPMGDPVTEKVDVEGRDVSKDSRRARAAGKNAGKCRAKNPRGDEFFTTPIPIDADNHPFKDQTVVTFRCQRMLLPQRVSVTDDTDMVMFSIGGNDINFAEIVTGCLTRFGPLGRSAKKCQPLLEAATADLNKTGSGSVKDRITNALANVRGRMRPDGLVVINSYPYLERYEDARLAKYPAGHVLREMQRLADTRMREIVVAANRLPGPRVELSDGVKGAFAGHEPTLDLPKCGPREPTDQCNTNYIKSLWLYGNRPLELMESFHPNPAGQTAIADAARRKGYTAHFNPTAKKSQYRDIVLAVDTNNPMAEALPKAAQVGTSLVSAAKAQYPKARFAVVDFRTSPDVSGDPRDYSSRKVLDFTDNVAEVTATLNSLQASQTYNEDLPSIAGGLDEALDLDFSPPVDKSIIVFGQGPDSGSRYHLAWNVYDNGSAMVLGQPLQRNREDIDADISWFSFRPDGSWGGGEGPPKEMRGSGATQEDIPAALRATGGDVYDAEDTDPAELAATWLADVSTVPVADAGDPIAGATGQPVTLDARNSYSDTGTITAYAWDLDADGVTDIDTTTPTLTRTFADEGELHPILTVTDEAGRTAATTVRVRITVDGDDIEQDTDNCPTVSNDDQADTDSDGTGDQCDDTPGFVESTDPTDFGPSTGENCPLGQLLCQILQLLGHKHD